MTRVIKKYKNRRLYDTTISQYITLEELQRYVMQDIIFQVKDSQTGEDLTNNVLLQVFIEMESGSSKFLSEDLLRQWIKMANHPMNQAFKDLMQQFFFKF